MELPPSLRQAIEHAFEGIAPARLAEDSARLTEAYRAPRGSAGLQTIDDAAAAAYVAARLPATYAAARATFAAIAERRPDFTPAALLDVGAGPGTLLWAAAETWPELNRADLLERSPAMRRLGERIAAPSPPVEKVAWHTADLTQAWPASAADLVTAGYVLNELPAETAGRLIDRLWQATTDSLVLIEPGTPDGYARILAARSRLIAAGAHLVAPCPHAAACPLTPPDWCHFAQRVARSRLHRLAKGAEVPWEDERFSYLAVSRYAPPPSPPRVLAPVRAASGHLELKLCEPDGGLATPTLSRRNGEAYRRARRVGWGDLFER